jgi:UDP-glucose 4-epimerase
MVENIMRDLAWANVRALGLLDGEDDVITLNLGTDQGYSVLQMIQAFSAACGTPIPYRITPRRRGDLAICYADPSAAERILGWKAEKSLEDMCRDCWRWQQNNPNGYPDKA